MRCRERSMAIFRSSLYHPSDVSQPATIHLWSRPSACRVAKRSLSPKLPVILRLAAVWSVACLLTLHAAEPDWHALQEETITHFTQVLRMDTSNPPGNETRVAEYVKSVC